MRQICNVVYNHLADGLDHNGRKELDLELAVDPDVVRKYGMPSKGQDALMTMMGGKPPAAPGRPPVAAAPVKPSQVAAEQPQPAGEKPPPMKGGSF